MSKKTATKVAAILSQETAVALDALLAAALADHKIENLVAWKSEVSKIKDRKINETYLATLTKENQKLFWSIPAKAAVVEEIISGLAPINDKDGQILALDKGRGLTYFRLGCKCFAVKKEIGHGFWMILCEYLGINSTTANRAMRVYRKWKDERSVEKKLDGMRLSEAEAGPEKKAKPLTMLEEVEAECKRGLARLISTATRNLKAAQIAQEDGDAVSELMKKMGDEKFLRIATAIIYNRAMAEKGVKPDQGVSAFKGKNTADKTAHKDVTDTAEKEVQ